MPAMHWWRDTLFKRLFLLMWVALVVSHFAAFTLVTQFFHSFEPPHEMAAPGLGQMPQGLPPPVSGAANAGPPDGPPGVGPRVMRPTFPSLPPTPGVPEARAGLPTTLLVLDYGVRVLLIGLAAWVGARWLAAPVRRLVEASRGLAGSLGTDAKPPRLEERGATVDVQEAAEVFNEMAEQLHGQFRSRGLLMAAVSHDLRTPLTRMRIRLEALKEQPGAQRCIEDIREMDALIDTALQVFRDSAADEPLQPTDVFALVQSLTDDLQEQGEPVTLQGDSVVVPARAVALRRVLSNLLGNALRYGNRADVQIHAEGAGVLLVIEDEGPGIPAAELERVFEPFYRVEASRSRASGGAGLGLYIARDLLQRQGGSLRLLNRTDQGLRAEVRLHLKTPVRPG
jgi:signal transduction histidine kinase